MNSSNRPRDGERVPPVRGVLYRMYGAVLLITLVSFAGGCHLPEIVRSTVQPYDQLARRATLTWQARRQARQTWKEQFEQRYERYGQSRDVKRGFITAYTDAVIGGNGCPPPMPTRPLLSVYTLTHTFPSARPWYEGYRVGFSTAVATGVDQWRLAPVNPDLQVQACGWAMASDAELIPEGSDEMGEQDPELEPTPAPPSDLPPTSPDPPDSGMPIEAGRLPDAPLPNGDAFDVTRYPATSRLPDLNASPAKGRLPAVNRLPVANRLPAPSRLPTASRLPAAARMPLTRLPSTRGSRGATSQLAAPQIDGYTDISSIRGGGNDGR